MKKISHETIEELSKEIDVDMWTLSGVINSDYMPELYGDKLKKISKYFEIKERLFTKLYDLEQEAKGFFNLAVFLCLFGLYSFIRGGLAYRDYSPGTLETNKVLEGVILSQRDEIKKIREGRDIAIKSLSDRILELEGLNTKDTK